MAVRRIALTRRAGTLALCALAAAAGAARPADPCPAPAAVALDGFGPAPDFLRVAELAGAAPAQSLIARGGARAGTLCDPSRVALPAFVRRDDGTPLRLVPLALGTTWNSGYPSGDGDGLQWAGRGVSQRLTGGAAFRLGALSGAVAPEVTWSENRRFETVPTGRGGDLAFGNPYYGDGIDLPQRFGAGPLAAWGFGQSYLRLDWRNLALGISTENLRLGPGLRNQILLSDTGPGFPHVFVGTSRPADIWIGEAELLLFWGRLERSRYLAGGTHPLVNGLAVTYQPRWVPGLTFGVTRMFTQVWKNLTAREWLSAFQALDKQGLASAYGGGDNARDNQITSLFGRWVFPEAGFELYGEWAREDYTWSWYSELRQPDRGQAFTLGLQKTFRPGGRLARFYAETTVLQEMTGFGTKEGAVVYYVHGNDLSFTNRGQLLGAQIGPGGSSQTLGVDVFHAGGRIGGYLERIKRNDEYYWRVVEPSGVYFQHDVELTAGLRQVLVTRFAELSWDLAASYRWNRDFLHNESNFRLVLGVTLPGASPAPAQPL
jgi:hypothetical protein